MPCCQSDRLPFLEAPKTQPYPSLSDPPQPKPSQRTPPASSSPPGFRQPERRRLHKNKIFVKMTQRKSSLAQRPIPESTRASRPAAHPASYATALLSILSTSTSHLHPPISFLLNNFSSCMHMSYGQCIVCLLPLPARPCGRGQMPDFVQR